MCVCVPLYACVKTCKTKPTKILAVITFKQQLINNVVRCKTIRTFAKINTTLYPNSKNSENCVSISVPTKQIATVSFSVQNKSEVVKVEQSVITFNLKQRKKEKKTVDTCLLIFVENNCCVCAKSAKKAN